LEKLSLFVSFKHLNPGGSSTDIENAEHKMQAARWGVGARWRRGGPL